MRRLLVLLAACGSPSESKVPGASITPHLRARPPAQACGIDISFQGTTLRYHYRFDELGRVAGATGRYAGASEIAETIEYEFDNLDHLVQMTQVGHLDGGRVEVVAQYDTLGDLHEYTWTQTAQGFREARRYAYSAFTDAGQPTREAIFADGIEHAFRLAYDATGRIAASTPEGEGMTTIYTYDDDARTITVDTGNGAVRGKLVFDAQNRQLAESWDGTDPSVLASEDSYAWDGERLRTVTRRQGRPLQTVATETYRYDCR